MMCKTRQEQTSQATGRCSVDQKSVDHHLRTMAQTNRMNYNKYFYISRTSRNQRKIILIHPQQMQLKDRRNTAYQCGYFYGQDHHSILNINALISNTAAKQKHIAVSVLQEEKFKPKGGFWEVLCCCSSHWQQLNIRAHSTSERWDWEKSSISQTFPSWTPPLPRKIKLVMPPRHVL